MTPYQQRVVAERLDLDEKLKKIHAFLEGDSFKNLPKEDRELLQKQSVIMADYSAVLAERISRFA